MSEDQQAIEVAEETPDYMPPMPKQRTTLPPKALLYEKGTNKPATKQAPAQSLPPLASQQARTTDSLPRSRRRHGFVGSRPMWLMLLGVLIVITLAVLLEKVVIPAWGWTHDQWTYGNSRITQMDADVGHGGTSHFIALYRNGDIVVIEIALDHPNADHIYTLTGFLNTTATPVVLLTVTDANHDGKPDLILQIEGSSFEEVLYNTGTAFSVNEVQ